MAKIWNIRGTNGSGKSTLVRSFLTGEGALLELNYYASPTKRNPNRMLRAYGYIERYGATRTLGIVGPYETPAGGMDALPSFDVCFGAIRSLIDKGATDVLCEGGLASTVFGSWATFCKDVQKEGHEFHWVYLKRPLDDCLNSIRERQEASNKVRAINAQLLEYKIKAVNATR
jgi:hypothetical protein